MLNLVMGGTSHFFQLSLLDRMKQIHSESKLILLLFSFAENPVASSLRS